MAGVAVLVTLFLIRLTPGDRARRFSVLVFGLCMIVLYSASGLYHALRLPPDRLRVFQRIDMSAIYLLIAGTCTPVAALLLRGRFRATLLAGVWVLALIGIGSLWLLPRPPYAVLVAIYLGMGWLGMAGIGHYWRATGWRGMRWAIGSGAFYSLGAAMELANWPVVVPGVVRSHELMHFCDIAGTACHIVFLIGYVLPYQAPAMDDARQIGEAAAFVEA
jgi:hemolysin III